MRKLRLLILIALIFSAAFGWRPSRAQTGEQFFEDTGHYVKGEFLAFYHRVPDPELVYGNPITEAFQELGTGLTVQYFEKARFELHAAEPAAQRVQLTPVGEYLRPNTAEAPSQTAPGACRSFTDPSDARQQSYAVCYSFLDFFDANGGLAQFGYPVSPMQAYNGIIMQYFERARFEWRPAMGGSRVVLTDVGRMFFYQQKENIAQLEPPSNNAAPENIKALKARAYPAQAVTGRSGVQTIHVLVLNQVDQPVIGANVTVKVHLPSGSTMNILGYPTDEFGITQAAFTFPLDQVGMARIEVTASKNGKEIHTETSFRVWY